MFYRKLMVVLFIFCFLTTVAFADELVIVTYKYYNLDNESLGDITDYYIYDWPGQHTVSHHTYYERLIFDPADGRDWHWNTFWHSSKYYTYNSSELILPAIDFDDWSNATYQFTLGGCQDELDEWMEDTDWQDLD